ncbi:hypothetical protein C8R45DRAFT_935046 [Mycena sanguinolenta]|nr:hypothetical protein C8R45DRAFT_935046 [Mycena sanguinolenta]
MRLGISGSKAGFNAVCAASQIDGSQDMPSLRFGSNGCGSGKPNFSHQRSEQIGAESLPFSQSKKTSRSSVKLHKRYFVPNRDKDGNSQGNGLTADAVGKFNLSSVALL